MFEKSDQRFLKSLESDEAFKSRLSELNSQRLFFIIPSVAVILTIICMGFLVLSAIIRSLNVGHQISIASIATPAFGCIILLAPITALIGRAVAAHSEIRALLVYKKLRDDKIGINP